MSLGRLSIYKGFKLSRLSSAETSSTSKFNCRTASSRTYPQDEYTDSPIYPQILDLSPEATYRRDRDNTLDKMKRVGTIEEKLLGINMPRYYGWSSLMLKEGNYPFNFLPFVQHITRTDLIGVEKFPFSNSISQSEFESAIKKIRPQLQEAILIEVAKKRHRHIVDGSAEAMGEGQLCDEVTKGVVEQINRILSVNLAHLAPHLYDTEVDFEPRIEAFWRVGGFYPDNETYKERKEDKEKQQKELKRNPFAKRKIKEEPDDLVGHFIQYLGHPVLQLRHSNPLMPLEPQSAVSAMPPEGEKVDSPSLEPNLSNVPVFKYDPGFYGLEKIRRFGTNIPGFWPGDPNEFGLLSFHTQGHLIDRPPSFGEEDLAHTVNSQGILAGYAWLLAQANYQGFSTFHDVTYPLATTTIITDGRFFSFFASQLNTLLLHDEFIDINPKVNVCYGLPTFELYQEIKGDEIIGWDDRALSLLMEAYLNTPAKREGVDLKPYVDKETPLLKDIDHLERRVFLHDIYRHIFSNRPRHKLVPEIYDWERIYKIKFQKRPIDARRRFFELDIDPFKKRLDEHEKIYIPKKLRPADKPRQKFRDLYWPDC